MPLNWSILLKDPTTGDLTFTVVVGKNAKKLRGLSLPKGEGIASWIGETGQSLIVEDVAKDHRFSERIDRFTGFETESIIGVPLKTNEKVFGVIELINKLNGELFTPLELKVLTTIADFAAIAIEKAYYVRALRTLADTDTLTGVYNRGAFERLYLKEVETCKRYGTPLSFLMVDVDKFKEINDTHGHPAGDLVLKNLCNVLDGCVRKVDDVFRYGGDEFVILMPNTTKEDAKMARERILQRLEYQNSLGPDVPYTVSIGLHSLEKEEDSEILKLLDTDLYREKDKKFGKNIDNVGENLENALKDERASLSFAAKNRRE